MINVTLMKIDFPDHMTAFEDTEGKVFSPAGNLPGKKTYIFVWEDQLGRGDSDFNDLIEAISEIHPVLESKFRILNFLNLLRSK